MRATTFRDNDHDKFKLLAKDLVRGFSFKGSVRSVEVVEIGYSSNISFRSTSSV